MTVRSLAKFILATVAVASLSACAGFPAPKAQQQAHALECDIRTAPCAQSALKQCPRGYDVVQKTSGIAPLAVKGGVMPPADTSPTIQCR